MDSVSFKDDRIMLAKLINAAQRVRAVAITRRGSRWHNFRGVGVAGCRACGGSAGMGIVAASALMVLFLLFTAPSVADACTRILWTNNLGVFTGRTMDWAQSTEPLLIVFPRGIKRDGGVFAGHRVVEGKTVTWTSKYGSIVTSMNGMGAVDGMNQAGLSVHLLYFSPTDFGARNPSIKGLQAAAWAQYILDNSATVQQAISLMDNVQLVQIPVKKGEDEANVHMAVEDTSGDSVILEYVHGKLHVYHNRLYKVMTNDPAYPDQLEQLKRKDFSHPGKNMPLPGNVNAVDRFQRASYYLSMLREPKTVRQAVASLSSILNNVSVPFGAPYGRNGPTGRHGFDTYNTEYRTITYLTNERYYFQLATAPSMVWGNLLKFDLKPGAPVMMLNPDNTSLSGNVTGKFHRSKGIPF